MKQFVIKPIANRLMFLFGIIAIAAIGVFAVPQSVQAMTGTILPDSKYAWGENIGWMNFAATGGNVTVTDTTLTGYVWSYTYGWINLGPFSNYGGVTNTLSGQLGGYAWSSGLGWIPMSGASISTTTGIFHGVAGNSGNAAARINFDCSTCKVATDWRPTTTTPVAPVTTPATTTATTSATTRTANTTTPPAEAAVAVVPLPATPAEAQTSNPSQLFDIRLSIKNQNISKLSDLVAQVSFTSFGNVATPVAMTFTILDSTGKVVWAGQDSVTVQTESLFTKNFPDVSGLAAGKYTLKLYTVYNGTVADDFTSTFTITAKSTPWYIWLLNWWWLILIIVLLALFWFFFLLWKRRRKKDEEEEMAKVGVWHR